jgi:hypothetical protein
VTTTSSTATVEPTSTQTPYTVRLRHDAGIATITVVGARDARQAVRTVLDVEHAPQRAVVWVRRRPVCDYCDQSATRYERGSGAETPLCGGCARDHYGTAAEVAACTGQLGITRLVPVDDNDWHNAA